jgi:hypothetical protein
VASSVVDISSQDQLKAGKTEKSNCAAAPILRLGGLVIGAIKIMAIRTKGNSGLKIQIGRKTPSKYRCRSGLNC